MSDESWMYKFKATNIVQSVLDVKSSAQNSSNAGKNPWLTGGANFARSAAKPEL